MAEAYTLYHSNGEFASKEEELDFFRTNGVSLYLKKSTDDTSTALSQLATPDEISLDESLNNSFQISSPRERDDLEDADASTPHSKNPPNSDIISSTPSASLPMNEDPYLLNGATPTTKSRKRKRCSSLDLFNRKASKIVNYISSGNCNQYLLDIFNLKIPSVRLVACITYIAFTFYSVCIIYIFIVYRIFRQIFVNRCNIHNLAYIYSD